VTDRPVNSLIAPRPEARGAAPTAAPRSPDAAVLLVDDRPENLLALDAVLAPLAAGLGVRLLWARSADEALRHALAEGDRLAVVLLDVMMPGTDGPATARLLRARARTAQVPIVFVTALDADATRLAAAYGAGGVDYVAKPIDADVLRAKVAAFVDLHRERAAAGAAVRRDLLDRERAAQAAAERERADAERTTGRMRRLLALTEALTAAATPDDVARALVAQGVRALGAGAGVLALLTAAPLGAGGARRRPRPAPRRRRAARLRGGARRGLPGDRGRPVAPVPGRRAHAARRRGPHGRPRGARHARGPGRPVPAARDRAAGVSVLGLAAAGRGGQRRAARARRRGRELRRGAARGPRTTSGSWRPWPGRRRSRSSAPACSPPSGRRGRGPSWRPTARAASRPSRPASTRRRRASRSPTCSSRAGSPPSGRRRARWPSCTPTPPARRPSSRSCATPASRRPWSRGTAASR
jgi:CheY-like chemotaxis protein